MKVILLDNIKGVGKKDQVINASDGYARNFLFPKKLAVPADSGNMSRLNDKKSSKAHKKEIAKRMNYLELQSRAQSQCYSTCEDTKNSVTQSISSGFFHFQHVFVLICS